MAAYAIIVLAFLQLMLSCYCWRQWHKWENAYWSSRKPRDKEMLKKTVVMPYQLPWSKYND